MKPEEKTKNFSSLYVKPAAMKACPGTGMLFSWFFFHIRSVIWRYLTGQSTTSDPRFFSL
jgi:hypothetical protein